MKKTTLVIMAAGIGSRFGGGIKQLEPVGPNGEIIMDYSIFDAIEAGFNKIVFVIRKDLEKDFKEIIGNRIEKVVDVDYVYQELDKIPAGFDVPSERKKPWGTGQAILCCKGIVNEPFGVINADDFYAKDAYVRLYNKLQELREVSSDKLSCAMMGFILGNTLSENGGVTRGLCKVDENLILQFLQETTGIIKTEKGATIEGSDIELDINEYASMNMWGFTPDFLDQLEKDFVTFFKTPNLDDIKKEFLLPIIVEKLMAENKIEVSVVPTNGTWFGVTYKEDKPSVVASINELIDNNTYSTPLFK